MELNYFEFEKQIIAKLKDSKLIEHYAQNDFQTTPGLEVITKAFEIPSEINFDDQGLYFHDENGEKIYSPEMLTSITEKGEWLSERMPFITFDIDQNGNVRKADEAEAFYICICVANILKENEFKDEVRECAKNYDFIAMKNLSDKTSNFRDIVNSWQDLQSSIINILISACRYRISDVKKDIERFMKDGISDMEAAELRELESKVRSINFEYSEGKLSPSKVKLLTKIQRLQLIDERDSKISSMIKNSKAGILFRILKLSSEYISPVKKKKISTWVRIEVDKMLNDTSYENLLGDRAQLISKYQRRAIRLEKISVRRANVIKYTNNKEDFKFPSKL